MTENEIILHDYLREIEKYYKLGIAKEHSYRSTLQTMLPRLVHEVTAVNEPKRVACGAPDYTVLRSIGGNLLTIGYIEAKDIGVSLDKIEKDEQLKRYLHALDNLILTDYLEFRWYVKGEKQMTARLATPSGGKSLAPDKRGIGTTGDLLCSFLQHSAEPIRKPEELAKRMARLTHMIRDITIQAFDKREASDTLKGLYEAFKTVLLPDLPHAEFADMFAQTLAYGLFAARYNHRGNEPFNRSDAAKEIPRTNPFLRKLFSTIAGTDFDDEPFIGFVNELTQVLGVTDIDAVLADFGKRTRREDPLVHFYETFLTQYDPKLRELRGVYYTPEPVVSYIVRSVDFLLREHFDCPDGLADTSTTTYTYIDEEGEKRTKKSPRVLLLDPACGTGTFSYTIIDHIRETYRKSGNAGMWSGYVREHLLPRLFGFELLMAPYAVAHLKLGMQLAALDLPKEERNNWAYDFESDERLGVYLTNTLEQAFSRSKLLLGGFISDEANEAARVKQDYPVMVVLGNPPYSYESANTGKWISELIRDYYQIDNKPLGERNPKGLQDDYVKFIRFAQWRIEQTGYGILAFISNHRYLENPTFPGMRRSLMHTFDEIYLLNLHGSNKPKETPPTDIVDQNVFDIQQGVAISIFVKHQNEEKQACAIYYSDLWGPRDFKYIWLSSESITSTQWRKVNPQAPSFLFIPQDRNKAEEYERGWLITEMMPVNSVGLYTARDKLAIQWTQAELKARLKDFISLPVELAREKFDLGSDSRDWQVALAQKDVRTSQLNDAKIQQIAYRPFDTRFTYYTGISRGIICMPRPEVMHNMIDDKNIAICFMRNSREQIVSNFYVANHMVDKTILSSADNANVAPLYIYPDVNAQNTLFSITDSNSTFVGVRKVNLVPQFTEQFAHQLKMTFIPDGKRDLRKTFCAEDIFNYMYAVFFSPAYRVRYAAFLKKGFPRLPLTSNTGLFRELCKLGERLVGLHLMEKFGKAMPKYPVKGNDIVEKIEYLQPREKPEQGRVYINKEQYFEGVPQEVWNFHVGGYQVCQKWLKDRKGRTLTFEDIQHYQRIVSALGETIGVMEQIDRVIEEHGGWPIE